MSKTDTPDRALAARQRVEKGSLEALRVGLGPMSASTWGTAAAITGVTNASRAQGGDAGGVFDAYALLKTLLDNRGDLFRHDAKLRKARSFNSNSAAH